MPAELPKRQLGWILFALGSRFPSLRRWMIRWGLRTRCYWFKGHVPEVRSRQAGIGIKLPSFSDNYLSFVLFWRGLDYYEPLTTRLAEKMSEATSLFIDAGANIGFYSLRLAAVRPKLEIVAFEPHPRLHGLLESNVKANHFKNVTPEPIALSNREGIMPFYINRSDMSSSLEREFDSNHAGVVSVAISSLDDYLQRRGGAPDRFLLKVDVEGHEHAFFEGAEQTLRKYRPDIIAEAAMPYPAKTLSLLRRSGYRFWQVTDAGLLPCDAPASFVRDSLVFLNCLLTTRPDEEVAVLSADLKAYAKTIDLRQTSKQADARVLERSRRSFGEPAAPKRERFLAGLRARWPDPQTR